MLHLFKLFFWLMGLGLLVVSPSPALAQTTGSGQFVVTGEVAARPEDAHLSLTATTPENAALNQEQTTIYTITYGSSSTVPLPLTIQAHYQAPIPDSPDQAIDYVLGSASLGFGGAQPLIDQQAHTITWQLPALPPNTLNQTLQFELKTNSRYKNLVTDLPITVSAQITNPFLLPSQNFVTQFRFSQNLVPPTPTPTPTSPPQTLAAVRVYPSASLKEIRLTQLNRSSMTLLVQTPPATTLRVAYGTQPKSLSKVVNSVSASGRHQVTLTNLQPTTTYFLQFTLQTATTTFTQAEQYVFRTPSTQEALELKKTYALRLKTPQGLVFQGKLFATQSAPPVIVLPNNSTLAYDFTLDGGVPLQATSLLLYRPDLTSAAIAAQSSVPFGTPSSAADLTTVIRRLTLPTQNGEFTLATRIETAQGTIVETELAKLQLVKPLIIRHQKTGIPIANAKVLVEQYLPELGDYVPYPNPNQPPLTLYSQADGSIPLIPQNGTFRLKITRAPFYPKQVELTMRVSPTMILPDIELKPTVVSWLEPLTGWLTYLPGDLAASQYSLQTWLDEWSQALLGRQLFPPQSEQLSSTESF